MFNPILICILRYYCPDCGGTVSFLPSFAVPRRQYSAGLISICLQLAFVCGVSYTGINAQYPNVSRVLVGTWVKSWYYSSIGIITAMINHFDVKRHKTDKCSCHTGRYISETSLEAFFIVSDLVIGSELCECSGKCGFRDFSCVDRACSVIIKTIQEKLSSQSLSVPLL